MALSKRETDDLMNRVDALIKSLDHSPRAAATKLVKELDEATTKLEGILSGAWDFCGTHMDSEPAANRFIEVLHCYERGCTALTKTNAKLNR